MVKLIVDSYIYEDIITLKRAMKSFEINGYFHYSIDTLYLIFETYYDYYRTLEVSSCIKNIVNNVKL